MLEGVTLTQVVQLVVEVLVDFASRSVFGQKASEDTETSHPQNLAIKMHLSVYMSLTNTPQTWSWGIFVPWHSGVLCTLSLTETSVSTDSSCSVQFSGTGSGVHGDRLADDEAIADQLSDCLTRIGIGDFADFVGVEPDLAFATADDGRREALLGAEVGPRLNSGQSPSRENGFKMQDVMDSSFWYRKGGGGRKCAKEGGW